MNNAIALGCSHTVGVGVDKEQCYVSVLSQMQGYKIENLGVVGGNAGTNLDSLILELKVKNPKFVLAQWPSPIRLTLWTDDKKFLENINVCSPAFKLLLKQSVENFFQDWMKNIIIVDLLCKQKTIPIVHFTLEDIPTKYLNFLKDNNILVHIDEKLPEKTWLFDSKGSDKKHHSLYCHRQWAERLYGILNEYT